MELEEEFNNIINDFEQSVMTLYESIITSYDLDSFIEVSLELEDEAIEIDINKINVFIQDEIQKQYKKLSNDTSSIDKINILSKMKSRDFIN